MGGGRDAEWIHPSAQTADRARWRRPSHGRRAGAWAAHRGGLEGAWVAVIPERELAEFAASIDLARVPTAVVEGAKSLMIDWFGSALAGKDSPQVNAFTHFAEVMGPDSG